MKRIKSKKIPMPRQETKTRISSFDEVALGYTEEQALEESGRCLQCKNPECIAGCPVGIDIPAFIKLIREKDYLGAIRKIKEKNSLPAICGRVCPQEDQCERACILGNKMEPVAIGRLERFVADYEYSVGEVYIPKSSYSRKEKVAVVGSGPAGLTASAELSRLGYGVTLYESLHKPGGVLTYGIPEFRLPKSIVEREVEYVKRLGTEININYVIGRIFTIEELFDNGYQAVFLGIGAGAPQFMDIPGENLNGVYSANEYLVRSNLMKAYLFPGYDTPIKHGKKVAVVGGGNVAMDAARTALRLGAEHVHDIYRRSRNEMPAREEEVCNAEDEGIEFKFLTNPKKILGDGSGWVKGVECICMKLGEPDRSGRPRPEPISGSEFVLDIDTLIMAIGTRANPLLTSVTPGLKVNEKGYIIVDENGETSVKGVWAGGDIVTGSATVIQAMEAGKRSAYATHKFLRF